MTPNELERTIASARPRELTALAGHGKTHWIRRAAVAEIAKRYGLRPVRWAFDAEEAVYDGFTDDTDWNGFLNVWVIPAVHGKVIASFAGAGEPGFDEIQVDERGLCSYAGGFATQEVEA